MRKELGGLLIFAAIGLGACSSDSGASSTAAAGSEAVPVVLSSTPADNATGVSPCTGNPCKAKIILIFSKSMDSGLTPVLTTEVRSTLYTTVQNTNTVFSWGTTSANNDTLTMTMSWVRFPENATVRYTLTGASLKDTSGNSVATDIQRKFTTATANDAFSVADTGQTLCYNNTTTQACGDTVNFPRQDGDFANTPTTRNLTGPTQYLATGNVTSTDSVTGLVWKSCPEGLTGLTCSAGTASSMTWENTLNQCAAYNTANSGTGYGGRTNWRIPNARELDTLGNYANSGPAIETANFPSAGSVGVVSTATGTTSFLSSMWYGEFAQGGKNYTSKSSAWYAYCVSSPSTPTTASYTDNGDATVTDTVTNLRWQKCSKGQNNDATCSGVNSIVTWQAALQYCNGLTLASRTWRLPNINELKSLVDRRNENPSIDSTKFPATASSDYWSSTTYVATTTNAWKISYAYGVTFGNTNKTNVYNVRCTSNGP